MSEHIYFKAKFFKEIDTRYELQAKVVLLEKERAYLLDELSDKLTENYYPKENAITDILYEMKIELKEATQ